MDTKKLYFADKTVNLYHTDSLKWLKERKDDSIDMIFADPPYFLTDSKSSASYKGDWDLSRGVEADFKFHKNWITEARRILKSNGCIWITGTHHSIYQCGYALQSVGFHIINQICWYKPNKKYGDIKHALAYSHESIILARKSKDFQHYMNWKYLTISKDKFHKPGKTMPTIWDVKPCPLSEVDWHRTPKPVDLVKRTIMLTTKPESIILDPFNGSGTTGIAVIECGFNRRYIGLDKDKFYLDKTVERIKAKKENFNSKTPIPKLCTSSY